MDSRVDSGLLTGKMDSGVDSGLLTGKSSKTLENFAKMYYINSNKNKKKLPEMSESKTSPDSEINVAMMEQRISDLRISDKSNKPNIGKVPGISELGIGQKLNKNYLISNFGKDSSPKKNIGKLQGIEDFGMNRNGERLQGIVDLRMHTKQNKIESGVSINSNKNNGKEQVRLLDFKSRINNGKLPTISDLGRNLTNARLIDLAKKQENN
jgi:hypothetical protein